jgi:predicted N-acetyltransferase YhbS
MPSMTTTEAPSTGAADSPSGVVVRPATPSDGESCGRIFYDAFESIASRHALPVEPGSPEFTHWKVQTMLDHEEIVGLVAERDGRVLGSVFVDERGPIAGVGPVTVEPDVQDAGVGRILMEAVLRRERERGAPGVRLVQTAYHYRSLALYAKLGFVVRETLSVVSGEPPRAAPSGFAARPARAADADACDRLCERVHGHTRSGELRDAIVEGTAAVVERAGAITGYATGFGYGWHAVGETDDDLKALLGSAERFMGLGVLVPARNAELLRWCLDSGLRIVQQSTLMTLGLYGEPAGAYLPSIVY